MKTFFQIIFCVLFSSCASSQPKLDLSGSEEVLLYIDTTGHLYNSNDPMSNIINQPTLFARSSANPIVIDRAMQIVKEDFSTYNIEITFEEFKYYSHDPKSRIRCVLTQSNYMFPDRMAGLTVAFMGDTSSNMNCVILLDRAEFNPLNIGNFISHEVGHSLGMEHQQTYMPDGRKLFNYNPGNYYWSPVMGQGNPRGMTTWNNGTTSLPYYAFNELEYLGKVLGWKKDDVGNDHLHSKTIGKGSHSFLMNNPNDVDVFFISDGNYLDFKTFGNVLLEISVFDSNNNFLFRTEDLNVFLLPSKGHFVKVSTKGNAFVSKDVLMGQYRISVN